MHSHTIYEWRVGVICYFTTVGFIDNELVGANRGIDDLTGVPFSMLYCQISHKPVIYLSSLCMQMIQHSPVHLNKFTDSTQNKNKSVESLINFELGKVIEWLNINTFSLHKEKSKYVICHVPRKETPTLTLKIANINIEQVDEFNFLGLTLDANLTWKKHVNKIANKCSKTTGVLNKLKHVLPLDIKQFYTIL